VAAILALGECFGFGPVVVVVVVVAGVEVVAPVAVAVADCRLVDGDSFVVLGGGLDAVLG
jgi:hypothetical protein